MWVVQVQLQQFMCIGVIKISSEQFTIEQFYKHLSNGQLMAGKCKQCGKLHLPPRPLCDKCLSQKFKWIKISKEGKLLTYTTIYVAPQQFQAMVPYSVGIVQLEGELKLPGMIMNLSENQLKIGMSLEIDFNSCKNTLLWPDWPRYCFRKSGHK